MNHFTSFKLSLIRFLDQHPLYRYRNASGALDVLLVGYGSRLLDEIFPMVVTNGQLLDTSLCVTLANTNPSQAMRSVLEKAPYLPHFSAIYYKNTAAYVEELEDKLCTLAFDEVVLDPEHMEYAAEIYCECKFIIISTGVDEKNAAIAEAFGRYMRDDSAIVAYVQRKKPAAALKAASDKVQLIPFGFDTAEPEFSEELEKIGLNLHNSYKKAADNRCSANVVLTEFYHDKYVYISNIEAAIHIKAKLLSCGICCDDLNAAARDFSNAIESDPVLLNRLAAVEHNRWVLSKVFDGYRQIQDYDQIYQNGNTNRSTACKWHTCLVPVDHSGNSFIDEQAWKLVESGCDLPEELDPLDRMTLLIHRKCKERADANTGVVDSLLKTIRDLVCRNTEFSVCLSEAVDQLAFAVSELRMRKKSAISYYQSAWNKLHLQIEKEGGAYASALCAMMDTLRTENGALVEYVSRKDYKDQDRILCRSIPYALTHQFRPNVVKLLSERAVDNVAAIQQLEPGAVTFVGVARSAMELAEREGVIENLKRYFSRYMSETELESFVIVPDKLYVDAKESFKGLVAVPLLECAALAEELHTQLPAVPAYIDVTGADPLLSAAAMAYADRCGCGVFYSRKGVFQNLFRAEELEYPAPKQPFTVKQMFDISGAEITDVGSSRITGLESLYRELWEIAASYRMQWKKFTELPKKMCLLGKDGLDLPRNGGDVTLQVQQATAQKLVPILQRLAQKGIIKELFGGQLYGTNWSVKFSVLPRETNEGAVTAASDFQEKLQQCCNVFDPQTMVFGLNRSGSKLYASSLWCELSMEKTGEDKEDNEKCGVSDHQRSRDMLCKLAELGCIYSLQFDDNNGCKFRFASPEIQAVMEKAGNIAETYVYYTALLDAGFEDVENSFSFQHAVDSKACNEIDVICTNDNRSLFISVKDIGLKKFAKEQDYLNMVAYEIRYEAEHFGVNSKAALVAPALPMFEWNGVSGKYELSKYMKKCSSRGVYLCGRECFESEMLGRALAGIMHDDENWYEILVPKTPPLTFDPEHRIAFEDIKKGQRYQGVVKTVLSDKGTVFVDIGVYYKGTARDGAMHISEIADRYIDDIDAYVKEGDIVTVRVISVDPEKKRFNLSMKM